MAVKILNPSKMLSTSAKLRNTQLNALPQKCWLNWRRFIMILVDNDNFPLYVSLNMLKIFGFLVPGTHSTTMKRFLRVYWFFWFNFLVGVYIIVQFGDLIQIWGNLPLMVSTSFLLFTNCAFAAKIVVVGWRSQAVQRIIDEDDLEMREEDNAEGRHIIKDCNRETTVLFGLYTALSAITVLGWAASAEKNMLPLRAWYPYDAYKSPAFEITYAHQTIALSISAFLNVSLDIMMTTLMAVCRCRLKLTALALKNICSGIITSKSLLTSQEAIIKLRLRICVMRHQAALRSAEEIEACFTEPILGQFAVSMVIICVTAYQLAVEVHQTPKNVVRIIGMTSYLLCMIQQVFLYCYQGNQLSMESSEMAYAAYQCPWYSCSVGLRRSLLVIMVRSRRVARLTAGGFTNLSLSTFTSIIKASYTFFTVLQQVENR